ncbi:MAG: sugar phosphate isomerase/epimerase [Candidatus Latescibacteria bacterium]|nr:sugar phosphate isomerase/epimerase [Candidatus Latescibacterota bacterium]
MKLSLSVRVAEKFHAKREAALPLDELAGLAAGAGFRALCMRASQLGTHTPAEQVARGCALLAGQGLAVSMVTGDFPIPENTAEAPQALRRIAPHLDLAQSLGADLIRVALHSEEDIPWAQRAADQAAERGLRLAHQCHTRSLFEQVDESLAVLRRIGRPNFGLIYEPANLELCGQDYGPATIEKFAPYLFNVYLQNQRFDPQGSTKLSTWCRGEVRLDLIPLWEPGGIDFAPLLEALEKVGYTGYVTSHQAALVEPRAMITRTAQYLRSLASFE